MSNEPYKASEIYANETDYYYIEGAGATGYYGHKYHKNDDSCDTKEEAERIARLMNLAFKEGVKYNTKQIRMVLLIKD